MIKVTPKHSIPQYGIIMVEYPEQVKVEDPSLSQTLCRDWINFPSEAAVCTIFTANRTIIVNKGFQASEGGVSEATEYSWVVPYITNPATLIETDSFKVTTRDQFFNLIDMKEDDITVKMEEAAVFRSAELVLGSYVNADRTKYTFKVVATAPVRKGNRMLIKFPPRT